MLETANTDATVDVNEQPESLITLNAANIDIGENAELRATSGTIAITAVENQLVDAAGFEGNADNSRLTIGAGAVLDVSGASVERSVSDNIIEVELRGNQLSDSPVQRDGALRSETVLVDIRQRGVRSDGSEWQGTPIADASGEVSNIERTVAERNLTGGTVELAAQGAVVVNEGAVINLDGGVVDYSAGDVTTSRVLGVDGQVYDIAEADADREYAGLVDSFTVEHPRWGVTEVFSRFRPDDSATFESAYREGYDAGSLNIVSPNVAFGGQVSAATVVGRYQRQLSTTVAPGVLYRPFDELPLGGTLRVGNPGAGDIPQFVTGGVTVAAGATTSLADAGVFDAGFDFSSEPFTSLLDADLFGPGAITNAAVFSNGGIVVSEGTSLGLGAGGSLTLSGGEIAFLGDYLAPGGSLFLTAGQTQGQAVTSRSIELGATTTIDLAGRWVNDNPLLGGPVAPLAINGGQFVAGSNSGDILFPSGSLIDVSGGAQQDTLGNITPGIAGAVDFSAATTSLGTFNTLTLDGTLRAFALEQGGTLTISANAICVAGEDCASADGELWLTPDLYYTAGFEQVGLTANLTSLRIQGDAQIVGQQRNYLLPSGINSIAGGVLLQDIASVVTLPELERRPTALALTVDTTDIAGFVFDSDPGLFIDNGARLDFDAGSSVALASNSLIVVDGTIRAPGGSVSLNVDNSFIPILSRPPGGIYLDSNAVIDVSGVGQTLVDDLGRRFGRVFDGGAIDMVSARGGIYLASDATLLLRGATEVLDVPTGPITNPGFAPLTIATNGGSLNLAAAEFILPEANVDAGADTANGGVGGTLSVSIDGNLRGRDLPGADVGEALVSTVPRRVIFSRERTPIVLPIGDEGPTGIARLSEAFVEESGFANLNVAAETLFSARFGAGFQASLGQIEFGGGVDLQLPGVITLNAANFVGGLGDATLSAGAVRLGHINPTTQDIAAAGTLAANTTGTLTLNGQLIDLIGNVRIDGFDAFNASSTGDLRLVGVQFTNAGANNVTQLSNRELTGSVNVAGDITLAAQQVYPTTLAQFAVNAEGPGQQPDDQPCSGCGGPGLLGGGSTDFERQHGDQQRQRACTIRFADHQRGHDRVERRQPAVHQSR